MWIDYCPRPSLSEGHIPIVCQCTCSWQPQSPPLATDGTLGSRVWSMKQTIMKNIEIRALYHLHSWGRVVLLQKGPPIADRCSTCKSGINLSWWLWTSRRSEQKSMKSTWMRQNWVRIDNRFIVVGQSTSFKREMREQVVRIMRLLIVLICHICYAPASDIHWIGS